MTAYADGMRVALALGSGGARGYAHIGVLEVLAERGHEVNAIAGTSVGALVGGLHAAGRLPEFTAWVTGLTQRELLLLLDPALGSPGVVRAQRVLDRIADMLGDARIEELPIPFVAVATDLMAQREVWFERGPVAAAIRASIAIPTAITPVKLHGRVLADGGIMNPVPMDALSVWSSDFTMAVDLNATPGRGWSGQPVSASADETAEGWFGGLRRSAVQAAAQAAAQFQATPLGQLGRHGTDNPAENAGLGFEDLPRDLKTADVLTLSLNASQALVTRFRTAANPPDVWVHVPVDSCGTLDFLRATEMIELGRGLAADALDRAGY